MAPSLTIKLSYVLEFYDVIKGSTIICWIMTWLNIQYLLNISTCVDLSWDKVHEVQILINSNLNFFIAGRNQEVMVVMKHPDWRLDLWRIKKILQQDTGGHQRHIFIILSENPKNFPCQTHPPWATFVVVMHFSFYPSNSLLSRRKPTKIN